jgi:hypothetical protein
MKWFGVSTCNAATNATSWFPAHCANEMIGTQISLKLSTWVLKLLYVPYLFNNMTNVREQDGFAYLHAIAQLLPSCPYFQLIMHGIESNRYSKPFHSLILVTLLKRYGPLVASSKTQVGNDTSFRLIWVPSISMGQQTGNCDMISD